MERSESPDAMFYPAGTTVAGDDRAGELSAVRTELESVKAILATIEGSKFWKLRKAWVKLKSLTRGAKAP
jgi:hypothetical protein